MPRINSDGGMLTDNDSVGFTLSSMASSVDTVSASVCVSSLFSLVSLLGKIDSSNCSCFETSSYEMILLFLRK